jgi:hypothetical protein
VIVKKLVGLSAALALLASATGAVAVAATIPSHVRGTVSSVSPTSFTVTTSAGPVVVALSPKTGFAGALPASVADIEPGTFIGTANVATSGAAQALEVVIFPESMRGTGEGDYPWDLTPAAGHSSMTNGTVKPHAGSSMTNATVKHVSSNGIRTVDVAYKGGTKTIAIPANVPIVRLEPGTAKLLAPGVRVFVVAVPHGGALGAAFVVAGEHGTVPPM